MMIRKGKWILLLVIVSLIMVSCHKKEKDELCLTQTLERYGMTQYKGEDMGCRMFLTMYEYNNKLYFELGNHCTDMEVVIEDCAGNNIEETRSALFNLQFDCHALRIGIVGIE